MNQSHYRFNLSFKGDLVENSVDAYDLANTIIAMSQALNEVSVIKYGEASAKQIQININAFKQGSMVSEFIIFVKDNVQSIASLFPEIANQSYKVGKEVLDIIKTCIEVKKMLKGKKPKITPNQDGSFNVQINVSGNNNNIKISADEFKAIQDKSISKYLEKASQPLLKSDTEIKQIEIQDESKTLEINREDAEYLKDVETSQMVNAFKLKGFVSKIDSKTRSGFLSVGSRRVAFTFPEQMIYTKQFEILADSLKTRIQIYLIGDVEMDFEGNPKNMAVAEVKFDEKLI